MTHIKISYADEDELNRKLSSIMHRRGFVVTKADPERMTVGQLARMVGRPVSTVSRALKRPSCPPFESGRGRVRKVWIAPNARLLAFLRDWRKGQRCDMHPNVKAEPSAL